MTDVTARKRPKVAEALDDGSLIDVARPHRSSYVDAQAVVWSVGLL